MLYLGIDQYARQITISLRDNVGDVLQARQVSTRLRSRLGELSRDRKIAAYCQVGQHAYWATRILLQAGFSAANVGGGYTTYKLFQPSH